MERSNKVRFKSLKGQISDISEHWKNPNMVITILVKSLRSIFLFQKEREKKAIMQELKNQHLLQSVT